MLGMSLFLFFSSFFLGTPFFCFMSSSLVLWTPLFSLQGGHYSLSSLPHSFSINSSASFFPVTMSSVLLTLGEKDQLDMAGHVHVARSMWLSKFDIWNLTHAQNRPRSSWPFLPRAESYLWSWCALVPRIIHPQAPLTTNTTGKAFK